MRLLGRRTLAVSVGLTLFFPFSAAALITEGNLDIPGVTDAEESSANFEPISLRMIDVSDPAAPVEVGAIDVQQGICSANSSNSGAVCTANSGPPNRRCLW